MTRIICLSIRQPWAWAILHAGKDIENRDWATTRRGRVLIHAGKSCTRDEYEDAEDDIFLTHHHLTGTALHAPPLKQLERGGIVGSIEIVDCVESSKSLWFMGKYGFVLQNPRTTPFVPCKGQLGFFECPPDALKELVAWRQGRRPELSMALECLQNGGRG